MLAELPGLQNLHLEFNIDPDACRLVSRYDLPTQRTIHGGRYVPSLVLTKIRCCKELRKIKVQSLVLDFVVEEWNLDRLTNSYVERKHNFSSVGHGPYFDLQEELKEAMVIKRGSMPTV